MSTWKGLSTNSEIDKEYEDDSQLEINKLIGILKIYGFKKQHTLGKKEEKREKSMGLKALKHGQDEEEWLVPKGRKQ